MNSDLIIRTRDLTRRFGSFTAVDSLSIEVRRGWIFAFLGANGSGKSTTIRMLIGLLAPTSGAVEVDGIDVLRRPRRVRDRIGYMGQKVSLYQGLSIRENVEFYAGLFGLEGDALERRWGGLRERFALGPAEHQRTEDLPAALRQRAGLALATLHEPRLLFLDEPTAGVDVHSRAVFWDLIREQADAGVTVFVTTHFLEEAEFCDWVSFIDEGRLVANASPRELRARFSPGYLVRLRVPNADDARLRSALAAAAFEPVAPTGAATAGSAGPASGPASTTPPAPANATVVDLRFPDLTPVTIAGLAAIVAGFPEIEVQVDQPEMADVFRAVIRQGQAGRATAGGTEVVA